MAITKEYFSHDYLTRSDPKVRSLMARLGVQGYGVFWCIVEILYQSDNIYPCDHAALAYELRVDEEVIRWIIEDSGLFVVDNNCFSSVSIARRLDKRNEVSQKKTENARKRWEKAKENPKENKQFINESDTYEMQKQCKSNADAMQMHNTSIANSCKVKEKVKGKEDIINNISENSSEISTAPPERENIESNPSTETQKKAKDPPSDEAIEFALWFRSLIPKEQRVSKADMNKWGYAYEEMIRLDKRPPDQILAVCEWGRENSFWKDHLLSPVALRQKNKSGVMKYDTILTQMKNSYGNGTELRNNQKGPTNPQSGGDPHDTQRWIGEIFGLPTDSTNGNSTLALNPYTQG